VELYNSGTTTIDLTGWYLADNYTNLTRWAFPAGTSVAPGQFRIVWLDGEPAESNGSALHTSFGVSPAAGSLALVFPFENRQAVLDYINYTVIGERSIGYFPDGVFGPRDSFFVTTPGAANDNTAAPLPVFINEWMAANTSFVADPADGDFDDWFELYNPNDVAVDLTDYALSDVLTVGGPRWSVPAGTTIPARGFLLVWADNETGQNATNRADLHANFQLRQAGEAIGLFAPNGSVADSVTFGNQTNNISEGRWRDGAQDIYFMPTPTPRAANVVPFTPPGDIEILNAGFNGSGDFVITWSAEPGISYRIQFKDNLSAAGWQDLSSVEAVSSTASVTDPLPTSPAQRFYRIQRLSQ
jgi:hypothetical protein